MECARDNFGRTKPKSSIFSINLRSAEVGTDGFNADLLTMLTREHDSRGYGLPFASGWLAFVKNKGIPLLGTFGRPPRSFSSLSPGRGSIVGLDSFALGALYPPCRCVPVLGGRVHRVVASCLPASCRFTRSSTTASG